MAPVRLRHPKGVTTIQVDFTNATVQDLQQEIFAATEIPPSQQDRAFPAHPSLMSPTAHSPASRMQSKQDTRHTLSPSYLSSP